jgi:hypothetical protein
VADHQRRLLHLGDDVGEGEGLARAGRAQQRLVPAARRKPLDQLGDRLPVAGGREIGLERTPLALPVAPAGKSSISNDESVRLVLSIATWHNAHYTRHTGV